MAELLITAPPDIEQNVSLEPGRYTVGRGEACDIQLEDDTLLSAHCELVVDPVAVKINALDPRAVLSMNGQPVSSALIPPGVLVSVGSYQVQVLGQGGEAARPSFGALVRNSFVSPMCPAGLATIAAGAVGLALMNMLSIVPLMGLFVTLGVVGYLFAFAQSILLSAAYGEKHLPNWPGTEGGIGALFGSALQFLGVLLCLFGPGFAVFFMLTSAWWPVGVVLFLLGLAFMPVTLMAVSLMGGVGVMLNPPALVQAAFRMGPHYAAVLGILAITLAAYGAYATALAYLVPVPVLPDILDNLVYLYLLIVWMKLIGSLYYLHSERLGWGR